MLRALVGEIASLVTHLARYPTGVGRRWTIGARPTMSAPARPLVVLPGLAENLSIFAELRRTVPAPVVSFSYCPVVGDVRAAAVRLAAQIEQLCIVAGVSKVDLVGHS